MEKFKSKEIQEYEQDYKKYKEQKKTLEAKVKQLKTEMENLENTYKDTKQQNQDVDVLYKTFQQMEEKKKEIEFTNRLLLDFNYTGKRINEDAFIKEWEDYRLEYDKTKLQPILETIITARRDLEKGLQEYGELVTEYRQERDNYCNNYFGGDIQMKIYLKDFNLSPSFLLQHGLDSHKLSSLLHDTVYHLL